MVDVACYVRLKCLTGSFLAIATSFETIHIELLYGATSSVIVPGVRALDVMLRRFGCDR